MRLLKNILRSSNKVLLHKFHNVPKLVMPERTGNPSPENPIYRYRLYSRMHNFESCTHISLETRNPDRRTPLKPVLNLVPCRSMAQVRKKNGDRSTKFSTCEARRMKNLVLRLVSISGYYLNLGTDNGTYTRYQYCRSTTGR